ncbi:hypothetical protein Tco_0963707 [Tanacetum coccineum]
MSFGFDKYQPPQSFDIHQFPQETSKEILRARENLMEAIEAFLKEYDHISPNEKCMALLLAEERFLKIKQTMEEEQNQPEVMQELLLKLMDDLEELSEYINYPSWNRPTFYDNKDDEYTIIYSKPKAITPDLPIEEPDNSLSMGNEHLDTIPSVENLVPILSELEGISEDTCDVPVGEDSSTFDALSNHSEIISDSNNDGTSSDDDSYENIEYVEASLLNLEIVSLEEVNKDQEDKDRLIANIEALNDNPSPDHVLKSPSLVPISIMDSDSFFEKSDTSFSFSDNSLPEFETFSDHKEETRSGSSTTHANNSLPEYDLFLF